MDNQTLTREFFVKKLKELVRHARPAPAANPHLDYARAKVALLRKEKALPAEGSPADKRFLGPAPIAFVKRLLRLPLFWYVNPIAKQQAKVNSLQFEIDNGLCAAVDSLRREIAELKKQIDLLSHEATTPQTEAKDQREEGTPK